MEEERLYDALEVCLAALSTGVDIEACLSLYPELTEELRPVLEAAAMARFVNEPETQPAVRAQSQTRMWNHKLAQRALTRPKPLFLTPRIPGYRLFLILSLLVVLLAGYGVLRTSSHALPGDRLYRVKRVVENFELSLSPDPNSRRLLESDYNERRAAEVKQLLNLGRVEAVSFEGLLTQRNGDHLVIDGIPTVVTSSGRMESFLHAGMVVEVEGQTKPTGVLSADEVHLLSYKVIGHVDAINSNRLEVAGTWFRLAPTVRLDPELVVGDSALVLSRTDDDGALWADAVVHLSPAVLNSQPGLASAIRQSASATPSSVFQPFLIEFQGQVQTILGQNLIIDGKRVKLSPLADVTQSFVTGDNVQVQAWVEADGSLTATFIQPAASLAKGGLDGLSGSEKSGSQAVTSTETRSRNDPSPTASEARSNVQSQPTPPPPQISAGLPPLPTTQAQVSNPPLPTSTGSIAGRSNNPSPTQTSTNSPATHVAAPIIDTAVNTATPTRTPVPSATPIPPSSTPAPSPTHNPPTSTPVPSATHVPPTSTPVPSPTQNPPTSTPVPSATPIPPSSTPVPSATPNPPTSTPVPSDTPIPPTSTPAPSDTPNPPTSTPAPLDTPIPPTSTPAPTNTQSPPTSTPSPSASPSPAENGGGSLTSTATPTPIPPGNNGNENGNNTGYRSEPRRGHGNH